MKQIKTKAELCNDVDGNFDDMTPCMIGPNIPFRSMRREERIFCVRGKYKYKSRA
jgi:hypothetical protein